MTVYVSIGDLNIILLGLLFSAVFAQIQRIDQNPNLNLVKPPGAASN
jgi:hypothetical protein